MDHVNPELQVVVLSGGVGGAKLVDGLARHLKHRNLSVIGNVGDDEEFHGLWVSPDIDTLVYTLAGLAGQAGWGIEADSFNTLRQLRRLGRETWMQLGDTDLAVHIYRTEQRRLGRRPSDIAAEIQRHLGVDVPILLPTDDPLHTRIRTESGWLTFQEYFVREHWGPRVFEVQVDGITRSRPTPEAMRALEHADVILIAPSNPVVSIAPILAVPGIREAVRQSSGLRIVVSPTIAGRSVKGPTDSMLNAIGRTSDAVGIVSCYSDFVDVIVIDQMDRSSIPTLRQSGVIVQVEDILMRDAGDRVRLAASVLDFAGTGLESR